MDCPFTMLSLVKLKKHTTRALRVITGFYLHLAKQNAGKIHLNWTNSEACTLMNWWKHIEQNQTFYRGIKDEHTCAGSSCYWNQHCW